MNRTYIKLKEGLGRMREHIGNMSKEIIIALISAGVLGSVIKWWGKAIMRFLFNRPRYSDTITKMTTLYEVMQEICINSSIERVLILKSTNGGGIPHIGSALYISVLHEFIQTQGLVSIKNKYQRLLVDQRYIEILAYLAKKEGPYKFITAKEKPGQIKTVYDNIGITRSDLYYIHQDKTAFYYAAFSVTGDQEAMDDIKAREAMMFGVNKLRNTFLMST